jgi:hypothetical protein
MISDPNFNATPGTPRNSDIGTVAGTTSWEAPSRLRLGPTNQPTPTTGSRAYFVTTFPADPGPRPLLTGYYRLGASPLPQYLWGMLLGREVIP